MAWIKLTLDVSGSPVCVNINNVQMFKDVGGKTKIIFPEYEIIVSESFDDVYRIIRWKMHEDNQT